MRLPIRLAVAAVALAVVPVSTASAASVKSFGYEYKVVKASSLSSASENSDQWSGGSTETWKLGKKKDGYPNTASFASIGSTGSGAAEVSVKGEFEAHTVTPLASCTVDAPTGSTQFPAEAPSIWSVQFDQKKAGGTVEVHFIPLIAQLAPPDFESECAHPDTVLPQDDAFFTTKVKASVFKRKRFTLTNSGQPGGRYGNYKWKMQLTLERKR